MTFTYSANALFRYEGLVGTPAETLVAGRHVRIYSPRPQTVLAFSASALALDRAPGEKPMGWVRQGFVHGVVNKTLFFTELRNGVWIDTFVDLLTGDLDAYRLSPEASEALLRPGDRVCTSPRITSNSGANVNNSYGHYLPSDDGSIIGSVTEIGANFVRVLVTTCPTGRAADVQTQEVMVPLDADAVYHLDGIPVASRAAALNVGTFVRILPAIPQGMYCVRDTDTAGAARQRLVSAPATQAAILDNNPVELTYDNIAWSQPSAVTVLENETVNFKLWLYTREYTEVVWLRNGQVIPGTLRTLDYNDFVSFSQPMTLSDNGVVIQCRATSSGGDSFSDPITLTVLPNTSPFLPISAYVAAENMIFLYFNRAAARSPMDHSAENPANYVLSGGAQVLMATLTGDRRSVVLPTTPLTPGEVYTITVNNVRDTSATPVEVAPETTVQAAFHVIFRYYRFTLLERSSNLAPRLSEIRYLVGGVVYGLGANSCGVPNSSYVHDGASTNLSLSVGDQIVTDFGISPIAADAVRLELNPQEGRQIKEFLIEGSNNSRNWIELLRHKVTIETSTTVPINLSVLRPQDILIGTMEPQKIIFPPIPDIPLAAGTILLGAATTAGLPVQYTVISGPATVNGRTLTLTLTDFGTVRVQATQPGNSSYYSAHPEEQTFTVLTSGTTPVARLSADPISGLAPLTVAFNGRASSAFNGAAIVQYAWDFGHGTTSSGAELQHFHHSRDLHCATHCN